VPIDLDRFAQQQLDAQGLTVKEFARRSGLGLSHAYQILRGERTRPSAETFDAVARGLNMTPAEMAVAMGKGTESDDPEEVEWLALVRQLAPEKKPAARDYLRFMAAQGVEPSHTAKGRGAGTGKRQDLNVPEITNDGMVKGAKRRSRGDNGELQPLHAGRWFGLYAPYHLFTNVLASVVQKRDSQPVGAAA
jgi:transcriptional regulator with XRE-family HTH domain